MKPRSVASKASIFRWNPVTPKQFALLCISIVFVLSSIMSILFNGSLTLDYLLTGLVCAAGVGYFAFKTNVNPDSQNPFLSSNENDLQNTNEAILREKINLATIIENSEDMIEVTDAKGHLEYVNPSHIRNMGYTLEELKGKPPAIFRSGVHDDRFYETIWSVTSGGQVWKGEMVSKRKDGTLCPQDVVISPVFNAQGRLVNFTAIKRDITERKETETKLEHYRENLEEMVEERTDELQVANQKLKEAKEIADRATHAKSDFLANMSHEIRTPLNAINGFSQILLRQTTNEELPQSVRHYLENINIAGTNLTEIINSILDFSKIEAGKLEMEYEPVPIQQLIKNVYQINVGHTQNKKIHLHYELGEGLPSYVLSDRAKLNQILMNLVGNAVKFTPVNKSIAIKAFLDSEESVTIQVIDQGIGIPQDRLKEIFNAFEQEDSSITRRFGGTGLGLTITKKLVHLLKGRITVESEVGVGSTFSVSVPFTFVEGGLFREELEVLPEHRFDPNNRVLLVEDNPMNQEMAKALFEEMGIALEIASDGQEGIEKTFELHPELILMDLHMPLVSGLEATQKIRERSEFAEVPIIALSADAFHQQQEAALQVGVSGYLTKPLEIGKLLPILEKYLRLL